MDKKPFEYSREWYENEYHAKGDYNLPERTWDQVQGEWDAKGHHLRFVGFLHAWANNLNGKNCIDIGCHHAKSMSWCFDEYPAIETFTGVDFSQVAIDWCSKNFPRSVGVEFISMDVSHLRHLGENKFDVVFCVDMIEHLPWEVYMLMVKGIKYICKPGGKIVCQIGKTIQPEHINIIPDQQAIEDFGLPVDFRHDVYFVLENVK